MNDDDSVASRLSASGIGSISWPTVAGVSAALMLGTFIILGMASPTPTSRTTPPTT